MAIYFCMVALVIIGCACIIEKAYAVFNLILATAIITAIIMFGHISVHF